MRAVREKLCPSSLEKGNRLVVQRKAELQPGRGEERGRAVFGLTRESRKGNAC